MKNKIEEVAAISFENMYRQVFDFPYEMIKHILAKASYNMVKKFYFTCKYFPHKYRLFLIDDLHHMNIGFKNFVKELPTNFNEKVWIGDKIITGYSRLSWWMLKIKQCSVNMLTIISFEDLNLSWDEFKILAKAGAIQKLNIGKVLYNNGMVSVEDICVYVPMLTELRISPTHVTENSLKSICVSLNAKKIKRFYMGKVDGLLNAEDYFEFIQKCGYPGARFAIGFCSAISSDQTNNFINTIESEIKKLPKFYFYAK